MSKEIRIMVACGSGVATSTIAVSRVTEILAAAEIKAKISKCSLGELEGLQKDDIDLVLTTSNYMKALPVSHASVFGLVSGVNAEAVAEKLLELCRRLAATAES